MANCISGEKKGRGMSNFTLGGSVGYIFGPAMAAFSVTTWGLGGIAIVLVPTIITSVVFFTLQKKFMDMSSALQREAKEKADFDGLRDDWPAFLRFSVSVFARSIVHYAMQTFIPLYWVSILLQTQKQGSLMVTFMACAGLVGTFFGGRLADRFGFRLVIRIAFAALFPTAIFLLMSKDVWMASLFAMLFMAASNAAHSPSVVLGQKYLPNHLGLASGVTLGLALSMGGIFSPLLGRIGDNYGLTATFYVLSGISIVAFLASLLLKEPNSNTTVPEP